MYSHVILVVQNIDPTSILLRARIIRLKHTCNHTPGIVHRQDVPNNCYFLYRNVIAILLDLLTGVTLPHAGPKCLTIVFMSVFWSTYS